MAKRADNVNPVDQGSGETTSRLGLWLESRLGRSVGESGGNWSWGLVFLLAVALYAVAMLIKSVLFFF